MKVNEIFYSLQGEGFSVGRPVLFIRLNGCNLQCTYCDTLYAWKKIDKSISYHPYELVYKIKNEFIKWDIAKKLVVWTGGEPLLQKTQMFTVIDLLGDVLHEIETNGTIMPLYPNRPEIFYNVSPKLSNSGIALKHRCKWEVLEKFNEMKNSIFKFVVQHPGDLVEIKYDFGFLNPSKIVIMPEGVSSVEQLEISRSLVKYCLEYGFNLIPRLQILLWEDKRGV